MKSMIMHHCKSFPPESPARLKAAAMSESHWPYMLFMEGWQAFACGLCAGRIWHCALMPVGLKDGSKLTLAGAAPQ